MAPVFIPIASVLSSFAAPSLANALGASTFLSGVTGSTAVGSALGAGVANAAIQGGLAAATGGDVTRAAALGGIGGGLLGYNAGTSALQSSPTFNSPVAAPSVAGSGLGSVPSTFSELGDRLSSRLSGDQTADFVARALTGATVDALSPNAVPATQGEQELRSYLQSLNTQERLALKDQVDLYRKQAANYDPEYYGRLAANQTAVDQSRRINELSRDYALNQPQRGGLSVAQQRRASLQAGANTQSSYIQGREHGTQLRGSALDRLDNARATSSQSSYPLTQGFATLDNLERGRINDANRQRDNARELFGQLFEPGRPRRNLYGN